MTITFYDTSTAPSPRRARIILAEKNVPHEVVQIDMMTNEQLSPEYRKINPGSTIPALKLDDGTVLTDNAGIAAYLEVEYPDPPLLGTTALEKAEVATWQFRIENGLGMAVASAFRNVHPAMKGRALPGPHDYEQIPELAERGLAQIEHFLTSFDQHMSGRAFIAGERFSVADVTAICFLDFMRVTGRKLDDSQPNILAYRKRMGERPSVNL
ncbi:MAG: glutathione S-transferase family protein [Erythrobacter sp.]